jgi:heterodisulfide reductase subunit C
MTPKRIDPELHPEQGPVWQWVYEHDSEVFERLGKNYQRRGDGTVREIDQQVLDEIHKIFDITGGTEMFETIERYSEEAARMMGMDSHSEEYMNHLLTANNGNHNGH